MFKHLVILLVIVVLKCDAKCSSVSEISTNCGSIQDLINAGQQYKWSHIYVSSNNNNQQILSNTFANIPNVKQIAIENALNYIEPFSFSTLLSLRQIEIEDCDLPIIGKNWFNGLPIDSLALMNSGITSFEENCFKDCPFLTLVHINNNQISHITSNVFSGTNIETLNLGKNNIQFIEQNAFANMPKLRALILHGNLLTSFNSIFLMGHRNPTLNMLFLTNNKISRIPRNSFDMLPNMTTLFLKFNILKRIDEGAFNGLTKLKYLDVSFNVLEAFPETAFPVKGLPSLEILLLNNNGLNYLSGSFVRYLPKLSTVNIYGNPWQCGCYKGIINAFYRNNVSISCANEYVNGGMPVCVVPDTGSDKCEENLLNATNLYGTYFKEYFTYKYCYSNNCNVERIGTDGYTYLYIYLMELFSSSC